MTTVTFSSLDGKISGFIVSGHSGFSVSGKDILCSAVSSAVYLVANTITDILHVDAVVTVKDGFMQFELPGDRLIECQDILKGLKQHLEALTLQFPKGLNVLSNF